MFAGGWVLALLSIESLKPAMALALAVVLLGRASWGWRTENREDVNRSDVMLTVPENAPPAFHLLAKPTGAVCNLDCTYCFYLVKEQLYPGSEFRMGDELLETYIKQLVESHQAPEVTVAWQGGEPTLMGLDFFKLSVEYAQKHKRPGQQVALTMQTNGTRLDHEWCAFLKEHEFLIGLSVDGPTELHDAYRVNRGERAASRT